MAGFIQDPIQFINLIADNLRDRYQTGFPVLKELVQNTDDSQATELHFGRSSGLSGNDYHVLLRGPGLFFINNGRFSPSDALGIRSFGQNSKAADAASIGKFGLGMKSVFHFCEAFFFLSHDGQRPYAEVLNPWSGPESVQSLHTEWDQFSAADARAIRDHLAPVIGQVGSDPERLFILWLPLRRKVHLNLPDGDQAGAIVSEYPGDDPALLAFLAEEDLPVRLAALMPMLRYLESVAYWDLQGKSGAAGPSFKVRLDNGAKRLSLLETGSEAVGAVRSTPSPAPISGGIRVVNGTSPLTLGFSGLEDYAWNRALEAMHGHELWPSSYVRDSKGHSREAKDKARPHGTVFFSRSPGRGRLITHWSVFLPLDEVKAVETVRCEGEIDFRLTLHGYFFVDAGRQKVHGLDDCDGQALDGFENEESLRRAWNCELLRSTVLPLLLPALAAFCADERLSDKAKTALSAALKNTSLVRYYRRAITERQSWLREITRERISWVLRGTERPVLKLPDPPDKDTARPWRLFPALAAIAEHYWLAIDDAPNLLSLSVDGRSQEDHAQWQEDQLLQLFASVNAQGLFAEATLLDYLESFLAGPAGPYRTTQAVRRALATLLKQGLAVNGEEGLRQNEARVRRIVSHLGSAACFRIVNDLPRSLLRKLLSADTEALPLPARFFPQDTPADAVLSVGDAALFLTKVEDALAGAADTNTDLQDAAMRLSEQLIKGVPAQHRAELLQRCAELRILGGFDCKKDRRVPISVREIREAREAGTLFGSAEGTTARARLGLAAELQKVLSRERIVVINRETASLALDSDVAVRSCDEHAVLRCLGLKPRVLGGLKERAALAGSAHVPSGVDEVRGLRFLLHADPEHFHDNATLWVLGRKQAPVWQKLWSQLVGGAVKPWNLLEGSVADTLSRREWDEIDIHEISAQAVLAEIEKQGTSTLTLSGFDQDECEQILKEVRVSDDVLWRSLPFHWTLRHAPVTGAAPNAYLDLDNILIPDEMLRGVDLIRLSHDTELAQRQQRLLKPLDEHAAIRIALNGFAHGQHTDVPDRWRVIMDALLTLHRQRREPSLDLQTAIKVTKWLPLTDEGAAKPEDVIDLDAAEEEIERALTLEPGAFVTPRTLAAAIAEHPAFPTLREAYFARGKLGLLQLGAALQAHDAYRIGDVRLDDVKALEETARVLGDSPGRGWQLLSALIDKLGGEDCFEALLPGMRGVMPIKSLGRLLKWIAERGGDQSRSVPVFNRYLEVLAREGGASNVLGDLKLRNQESRWLPSAELVSGVSGIAPGHVLDAEQARILSDHVFKNLKSAGSNDSPHDTSVQCRAASEKILRDYFQPWTWRVSPLLLSGLLILFGREDSIRSLTKSLLGQHSPEWLIDQYPWNVPPRGRLAGFSLKQAIEHTRIVVKLHSGNSASVHSILGKLIRVRLHETVSTLFVGRMGYAGNNFELVLRHFEIDKCTDQQLSQLLQDSITYLLKEVYEQRSSHLDPLWNQLDKSDQVDIELAKALMLDNIPFYLKQLGTHNHATLRRRLENFRQYERQEKEFGKPPKSEEYRRKKEQALRDLQQLIESDGKAQSTILDSVQRKIKDFQYQPESVPFELFQNADDALRNLELIEAYPEKPGDRDVEELPAGIRRFVIVAGTQQISFVTVQTPG